MPVQATTRSPREVGDGRDIIDGGAGTDRLRYAETTATRHSSSKIGPTSCYERVLLQIHSRRQRKSSYLAVSVQGHQSSWPNWRASTKLTSMVVAATTLSSSSAISRGRTSIRARSPSTAPVAMTQSTSRVSTRRTASCSARTVATTRLSAALRPQDAVELAPGSVISGYTLSDNVNGTQNALQWDALDHLHRCRSAAVHSAGLGNDEGVDGAFSYTPATLRAFKRSSGARSLRAPATTTFLSGIAHLGLGQQQGQSNLGQGRSGLYPHHRGALRRAGCVRQQGHQSSFPGLDPRSISNILGNQEAGLPHAGNDANIFFMAMGPVYRPRSRLPAEGRQRNDPDRCAGGGGPSVQRQPCRSDTRGTVMGYDEDGNPLHMNQTSPLRRLNQAYGSHNRRGAIPARG